MKFNIPGARNYSRGIKLLLISLIILLGITIYETTRVIRSGRRITETQDVMKYSKKVLTHALDNESRFRGYILTGQKNFLGPQENLQKEIYNGLGRLEKFTHEHPEQKARGSCR